MGENDCLKKMREYVFYQIKKYHPSTENDQLPILALKRTPLRSYCHRTIPLSPSPITNLLSKNPCMNSRLHGDKHLFVIYLCGF